MQKSRSATRPLEARLGTLRRLLPVAFVAAFPLLHGCDFFLGHELNPKFCEAHTDDVDCRRAYPDAAPDGPTMCTSDQQCTAPTGVCDLETGGSMTCVQCTATEATACMGATPACIEHLCQKCTAHTQCAASNVCLPDGTCADVAQVAYVQAHATGAPPCAKATPCGTLDDGVKANKPIVKIAAAAGVVADNKVTTIDAKSLTIVADPGAKLSRSSAGVILQVQNTGADVAIYDLDITAGAGAGNAAISMPNGGEPKLNLTRVIVDGNQGTGISATAGALSITKSTINGNGTGIVASGGASLTVTQSSIHDNSGGGLSIFGAQFDVTNSFIVNNGGAGTPFGGVSIAQTGNGTRRFEFNTVSNNVGTDGAALGVACSQVTQPIVLSNNIIYANQSGGTRTQVGGAMCSWTYSVIGPEPIGGMGNINMNPLFVDQPQGNFHIQALSPARDVANPGATITVDFDGDPRPQNGRSDIGADEIRQ